MESVRVQMDEVVKAQMDDLVEHFGALVIHTVSFPSVEAALAFAETLTFTTGTGEQVLPPDNMLIRVFRLKDEVQLWLAGHPTEEQNYEVMHAATRAGLRWNSMAMPDDDNPNLTARLGKALLSARERLKAEPESPKQARDSYEESAVDSASAGGRPHSSPGEQRSPGARVTRECASCGMTGPGESCAVEHSEALHICDRCTANRRWAGGFFALGGVAFVACGAASWATWGFTYVFAGLCACGAIPLLVGLRFALSDRFARGDVAVQRAALSRRRKAAQSSRAGQDDASRRAKAEPNRARHKSLGRQATCDICSASVPLPARGQEPSPTASVSGPQPLVLSHSQVVGIPQLVDRAMASMGMSGQISRQQFATVWEVQYGNSDFLLCSHCAKYVPQGLVSGAIARFAQFSRTFGAEPTGATRGPQTYIPAPAPDQPRKTTRTGAVKCPECGAKLHGAFVSRCYRCGAVL